LTLRGFLLAGGESSRMGRDKASLEIGGETLLQYIGGEMAAATGNVTIVAPPGRYPDCPWPRIADLRQGCGPLAGIEAALSASTAEWNLIAAVDMPGLNREFLRKIACAAISSDSDCVLPVRGPFVEPLCAAYRTRAVGAVSAALDAGIRKLTDALTGLQVVHFIINNEKLVANVNTPEDWRRFREDHGV
jgi:molybdopterin-guanine dinucleotide biosynthesis protein A